MKKQSLISLIFIMVFFIIVALICSGCTKESVIEIPFSEYYGSWINQNYETSLDRPAKIVNSEDGTYAEYMHQSDQCAFTSGRVEIKKVWTDSVGDIWYTANLHPAMTDKGHISLIRLPNAMQWYRASKELCKISNSGNKMEVTRGFLFYPKDIKLTSENYAVYEHE